MAGTLGTIRGQIALDVKSAVAGYVAVRAANAATTYALSRSSAVFLGVGKAMTAGGLLMAGGIYLAARAAAEFERKLDFFGAVSGATAQQMEAVRKKAIQLGQDTIFSAGQIADSFVELGKAGVSSKDIINGVGDAVAHLGAAADIPLDKAAQIMTSAVQTFELKAQDATHVADLLAGAANASIVEIEDLGVSLKYVGGVAANLHMPITDVINGLSLLGKYGIRGSTAGTSLRQILVSLSGTSKKATAKLKELGIITKDGSNLFFDAKGRAKSLADIFQILQDKTAGLTDAQKLAAFKVIFNNRALAAAGDLTREGAAGFAKMNAEIGKTTAAEVSAKRLDNLSGDIEILRGNIETLLIQAGSPMQNFLRGIVQGVTKLIQAFANLSPSTQQLILKIVAISAASLLFMGTVSSVIGLVLKFANTMKLLGLGLKFVGAVVKLNAAAWWALNSAMFANPVFWIIAAIVALIAIFVLLYKKNETFRNAIQAAGRAIVAAFKAVVAWFQTLPAWFSNLWNTIRNAFTGGWDAVVNFFTQTIPNWFTNMVNTITSTISGWWSSFIGFWQALPGQIVSIVAAMVTAVINWFAQLPYRVGYLIGFMVGLAVRLYVQFWTWIITTTAAIITGIANWFAQLPGRVMAFLTALWTAAVNLWNNLRTTIVNLAVALVQGVISFFAQLPGRVANFVASMVNRGLALFILFNAKARSFAASLVAGVVSFIAQLPGRVASFVQSMVTRAIGLFNSMVGRAREIAGSIVSAIRNGLAALPGVVDGAINAAISAFRAMVGRAFDAAKSFASGLWDGFKKGLGINSPSLIEKQMVQITEVVREETGTLRSQVRAVQGLSNRLQKVPSMAPTDQSLMSNYAKANLDQLVAEAQRLDQLQKTLQSTASSATAQIASRTDLSISAASLKVPASALTQSTDSMSGARLVKGNLSIDDSGVAFITGIAEDVVVSNSEYAAVTGRMN